MAASMAHEIKNALVAGKTFIDLLLEKDPEADLAGVVRREIGRIDSMVTQMLKFAGPSKGVTGPLHLHDVLDHSLRLVRPQMESKELSVNRAFDAAQDFLKGDEYQLEQAFVNLMLNSVEAMGAGGMLTVKTHSLAASFPHGVAEAAPARIRISVSDTGIGIPPEEQSHLFEPFFTTKPSGTGLGLAITRRILEEHGGGITVESKPGHGTTFHIVLPTAEAKFQSERASQRSR
jgi:two-component system sensor histidine kinase HydH